MVWCSSWRCGCGGCVEQVCHGDLCVGFVGEGGIGRVGWGVGGLFGWRLGGQMRSWECGGCVSGGPVWVSAGGWWEMW